MFRPLLTILLVLCLTFLVTLPARADEVEDLQRQIDALNKAREQSVAATKPLEGQLDGLKRQLAQIQAGIQRLSDNITQKEKEIRVREDKLAELLSIFNTRVVKDYKDGFAFDPLSMLLGSDDKLSDKLYHLKTIEENRSVIRTISEEAIKIVSEKEKLEKDRNSLAVLKVDVDKNAKFLDAEVGKAKAYQNDLSGQIAQLNAKQQAILAAKSGTFVTSVGDVPLADDPNSAPTFNPGFSPAFAAFSFGAYTHRNGMSQYGAKGRAESGQTAEQILAAYYPGSTLNKGYGVPATINVTGYGSKNFEDEYLMGIYEMPSSFPLEALKAQAVAARTYAVRQGGSICATESCQVFKPAPGRNDRWAEAVRATRGWVFEGGSNAQYSSTTGGYGNNSGWDTKCGNKGCWTGDAYEKIAGSPWFYKGWYRDRSGATCGRSHPWLTSEEMADILNAVILYKANDSADRISPTDTSCWPGNPFSRDEMRNKANDHGGAITSVSGVSVTYQDNGTTANVNFSTNRGSFTVSGSDLKTVFNLRAPGFVSIKSPLYNIERK